ncbi:MAG: hypothetical protein ACK5LC_07565, partial [Coprobacillaceae bacterium]
MRNVYTDLKNGIMQGKILRINKKNEEFLKSIQSRTPYIFHELYYCHNNRYGTTIQIFDYDEVSHMGFMNAFISDNDIVVTGDISHIKELEYNDTFDKMMTNTSEEANDSKKLSIFKDKNKTIQEFNEFDNHLKSERLNPKHMTLRLFVMADTEDSLKIKVNQILRDLELKKMGGYIQTNNLKSDVQSLTSFSNPIKQMVSPSTIADVLMRSEINIVDEGIPLLGLTTNGLYAPDLYNYYNHSYHVKTLGGFGSGKSSLIKSLEEGYYIRADHTMHLLDKHKEYVEYCKKLDILRVAIDENNHINLCQIPYVMNKEGIVKDEDITSRIGLIVTIFKVSTETYDGKVIKQLKKHLRGKYKRYNGQKLDDITNEEWFILGDVLNDVISNEEQGLYKTIEMDNIYEMRLGLDDMICTYGFIYNKKTNMKFDLTKSLCFDVSFLTDIEDEKVTSGYMTLLVSYLGKGVKINLEKNNKLMKELGVKPHQLKRPFFTHAIPIDETMDYAE